MTAPKQRSLFDVVVPFARGSDTSKAAADSMREHVTALASRVLGFIQRRDATCDEVEVGLGLSHQTCSARVNELRNKGRIFDTGTRRKTRSGRAAVVWSASP